MVTVAACSELAVVSRTANRISPEVSNVRIVKKAPYIDVGPDGVPNLAGVDVMADRIRVSI